MMFTKQELEFIKTVFAQFIFHGSAEVVAPLVIRMKGCQEKIDLLMADHPEDEEAGKKPAAKKPAAKKPAAKKPAAKK